jgi:hypothetical protein
MGRAKRIGGFQGIEIPRVKEGAPIENQKRHHTIAWFTVFA